MIRISGIGGGTDYKICADINLPFTFITAKESERRIEFVKVQLTF